MAKKKSKRGRGKRDSKKKSGTWAKSSDLGPKPADSTPLSRMGGKKGGEFRIPSIVMIPVCAGVAWFIAGWPGAIFGGVIGIFLWRMRA